MRKGISSMDQRLIKEIRAMPKEVEHISDITQKIIDDLKTKEFPIPIIKIMKELGFIVGQQELEDELSGYIVISEDITKKFGKDRMICVNSKDSLGHQRFTIAHELAHFLFDYSDEKAEFYNTYRTDDVENEAEIRANRFAAELLMPEDEFLKQYKKMGNDVQIVTKLAEYFQVSNRAIDRRFIELGLN